MPIGIRAGGRRVAVGDTVRYIVGGSTRIRPAVVVDIADAASGKLNVRVGSRVVKNVSQGKHFGEWTA